MKIYFAGSIKAGRHDQKLYAKIVKLLSAYGDVLTEHVGDAAVFEQQQHLSEQEIFEQDVAWLKQADVVVAEVTTPSLGVGYEIGLAESLGKPIVCLYRELPGARLSSMVAGNRSFTVVTYEDDKDLSDLQHMLQEHVVGVH